MTDLVDRLEGIVHEPTQTAGPGVDLTLAGVSAVTAAGRVDFGGGELEPADVEPVATELRDEDDDYGWWNLGPGRYLLEYNESLSGDDPAWLQPRGAVLERGATHSTLQVVDLPRVPLSVGGDGIHLKENARVSTLLPG